jgi:hypothetical protein
VCNAELSVTVKEEAVSIPNDAALLIHHRNMLATNHFHQCQEPFKVVRMKLVNLILVPQEEFAVVHIIVDTSLFRHALKIDLARKERLQLRIDVSRAHCVLDGVLKIGWQTPFNFFVF